MGAIGIVTATVGYTLVYYGVKLFAGMPVTMAYALGLTKTNNAPGAPAVAAPFPSTGNGPKVNKSPKLPKHPKARSKPSGPGRPPIVAPPP